MPDCCLEKVTAVSTPGASACAGCGRTGRRVSMLTLKHMVKPQFLGMVTKPGFMFCSSADCEVVYFHADGEQLRKTDVRVRVGIKEAEEPALLCYCFGFTRAMVLEQLREAGHCDIPKLISEGVKAGRCACEVRNPQGCCCLGNIAAERKTWQKMNSQTPVRTIRR